MSQNIVLLVTGEQKLSLSAQILIQDSELLLLICDVSEEMGVLNSELLDLGLQLNEILGQFDVPGLYLGDAVLLELDALIVFLDLQPAAVVLEVLVLEFPLVLRLELLNRLHLVLL